MLTLLACAPDPAGKTDTADSAADADTDTDTDADTDTGDAAADLEEGEGTATAHTAGWALTLALPVARAWSADAELFHVQSIDATAGVASGPWDTHFASVTQADIIYTVLVQADGSAIPYETAREGYPDPVALAADDHMTGWRVDTHAAATLGGVSAQAITWVRPYRQAQSAFAGTDSYLPEGLADDVPIVAFIVGGEPTVIDGTTGEIYYPAE